MFMTKKLYIIRHAKAEIYSFDRKDYDRNLIDKGEERAVRIAHELKEIFEVSDNTLAISSSANRAIQTAQIFCPILNIPISKIQLEKSIYEAYFKDILQIINEVDDSVDMLLVFGHNPGLSDLTNYICDSYIDLKTAQVACIELEDNLHFSELSSNTAHLKKVLI